MFHAGKINSIEASDEDLLIGTRDIMAKHFTVVWLETNLYLFPGFVPVWVGLPYSFMAICRLGARGCSSLRCGTFCVAPV